MHDFVGYREVELTDHDLGLTFPMLVLYPTNTPGETASVGRFQLEVARDAPVKKGVFPLVLISHGSGGTPLVYRTLAHYLARNGFIVGLPEHPFNNRNDNSWEGTVQNLTARPRHLRTAVDAFFGSPTFGRFVKPAAVGLIGHSMGGYTVLALAGGLPTSFPWESADGQRRRIAVAPDSRVKAVVLLAPATAWFRASGALQGVGAPILMLHAEQDEYVPYEHAQIVLNGVPGKEQIEHRVVPNAGHFAFLSPFPEAMTSLAFPPSQDPPGFDRARFHDELNAAVTTFLKREMESQPG